jgi:hypothetical protein
MANTHLFRPGLGLPTATIFDDYDVPWGYYFYTIREDDLIRELRFINVIDEALQVSHTNGMDKVRHDWAKRTEGDYVIFTPHPSYKGEQEFVQIFSRPWIQRFIAAPRTILERAALNNRVSVNFG